jgi:hypothetical protein
MMLDEYSDKAVPLMEAVRVIRAMRHRDIEKMAKGIEGHRLGTTGQKKSSRALSGETIIDWANAYYQANKKP